MHFRLFTGVLVLSYARLGCCGTCYNASSLLDVDAYMEHYVFRKVRAPSVYSCASECLMSSVCMSFNFETRTRTCGLNRNSSDQVAITRQAGFLYSDISNWPKALAGACSETPCPRSRCHVDRLSRASCGTEFQGCDAPPIVANAEMYHDGIYEGAVAVYTCRDNFLMCSTENSRVCQSTGNWNGSVGPCAQNSWVNPGIGIKLDLPCGHSKSFKLTMDITPTAIERVHVDVRGGGNLLCHIDFRLDQNRTIFNSRVSGEWGQEIINTPVPLTMGTESLVEIRFYKGMYVLVVDGSSIYSFADRYPDEVKQDVYVSGEAFVSAAHIIV
ncbi:uncharacterized protein [Haliotis asinina]|uniref:uncharacterized protein n=1 Tax=Haliotis asinina TaxID=109174 RepID=UPI003531AEA5